MPAMFLTDAEIAELTGYHFKTKQIKALEKMGIPHNVRPDGKPIVMVAVLTGAANDELNKEPEINWTAI